MSEEKEYDLIIIGGGIGASCLCLSLLKKSPNHKILVIEKSPVFEQKLGESIVEISAYYLQRLGIGDLLEEQSIKAGLRFLFNGDKGINQISEFASPTLPGKIYGYHLDRKKLDEALLERIQEKGVDVLRPAEIVKYERAEFKNELVIQHGTEEISISAPWVVDASGRARYASKQFNLNDQKIDINNTAVFTHINNPASNDKWDNPKLNWPDNAKGKSEYASIHLMRKNAWWWVIKLNKTTTSLGMVCDKEAYGDIDFKAKFREDLKNDPQLAALVHGAEVGQIKEINKIAYLSERLSHKGLVLLGDAGLFIDPFTAPGLELLFQQGIWVSELLAKEKLTGQYPERGWNKFEKKFVKASHDRAKALKVGYEFMDSFELFMPWLRQGNYLYFAWVVYPIFLVKTRLKEPLQFNFIENLLFKYSAWRYKKMARKKDALYKPGQIQFSRVGTPRGIAFVFKPIQLFFLASFSYIRLELKQLFKKKN